MNKRCLQRSAPLACCLLLLLMAVSVMLTWRAWRQAQQNHALIAAIKEGNSKAGLLALQAGADPNTCDISGNSPSLWQFFVTRFAPASQQIRNVPSALEIVVCSPKTTDDTTQLVKALLERGANPTTPDREGESLLFDALNPESDRKVFTLLVQHGANVNVKNTNGETPLMRVAGYDAELARLLLDNGADIDYMNVGGGTALGHAINGVTLGSPDTVVRLLISRHADVNGCRDKQTGNFYLWMARRFHEPGITTLLKKAGATL